jgi:hypothetical protein
VSVATGERVRAVPSTAEVQETAGKVAHLVSVLRRSWADGTALDRVAGPWCRWCPLLDECPEGRAATSILDR